MLWLSTSTALVNSVHIATDPIEINATYLYDNFCNMKVFLNESKVNF